MPLNNRNRQRIAIGSISFLGISTVTTLFVILTLYLIIQKQIIKDWIKKYFDQLLKLQPNNAFLKLSAKNLDIILKREYFLKYSQNVFIALGLVSFIMTAMICVISVWQCTNTKKITQENDNSHKKGESIPIVLLGMVTPIIMIIGILHILKTFVAPSNITKYLTNYIDENIPNNGKNPFIEIFKGIICSTFGKDTNYDLIVTLREKFNVVSYIMLSVSAFFAIASLGFLIYSSRRYEPNPNIIITNNGANLLPTPTVQQNSHC